MDLIVVFLAFKSHTRAALILAVMLFCGGIPVPTAIAGTSAAFIAANGSIASIDTNANSAGSLGMDAKSSASVDTNVKAAESVDTNLQAAESVDAIGKSGGPEVSSATESGTASASENPRAFDEQIKLPERSESEDAKAERKKEKEFLELSKIKKSVRISNAPCLTWLPKSGNPRAVLLCVHGLGLHNGTYSDFGQRMASLGYAVYAIDVRGFGSFMEAKGRETVDFDGCLKDIQSTLKVLHRAHKGLPVYLLGESMGGAIALRATAIYPDLVDGLISSVPANDRFRQSHTNLSVAVHLLENPDKPFDVGKEIISQATKKQDLREQWSKDPLNKLNLSPKELLQFQHFMNQNHKCAKLIQVTPVLFVQGCNDKLVKPKGTVELFNELSTKDRQIDLIANGEHLIFEENQFTDKGIDKVNSWINAHLASRKMDKLNDSSNSTNLDRTNSNNSNSKSINSDSANSNSTNSDSTNSDSTNSDSTNSK